MAHRHKMHRRAAGGRMDYTANSNVAREAGDKKDSFKRGGRHIGKVHGHKGHARADKRARGGGVTHSPFSSAARGEDMKRTPATKDKAQPRASGGGVTARAEGGGVGAAAFKHGGRAKRHAGIGGHGGGEGNRPHPIHAKHMYNFGAHHGSGHEEPLEHHLPIHHKHGGTAHHVGMGGEHHHAGHGAHKAHHPHHDGHHSGHHGKHGSHKARGVKHRAEGGKVDKEGD